MSNDLVSMAGIARLAEVERAAVSNWRRRSSDFPDAVNTAGRERFAAGDVATWLDRRRIPGTSLKNSEPVGSTYGQRFRNNATATDPDSSPLTSTPENSSKARNSLENLWRELEKHRGHMEAAHYRDLVLGLLYLRVQDASRWSEVVSAATKTDDTRRIGDMLTSAVADHRPTLPELADIVRLSSREGEFGLASVVLSLERIPVQEHSDGASVSAGGLFEFLLDRFAISKGGAGEFYTPDSVTRAMTALVDPRPGEKIHDPCCGFGSLLTEAVKHVRRNSTDAAYNPVSGYALADTSRKLAAMNLSVHGINVDLGPGPVHALREPPERSTGFDVIVSNPPFVMRDWWREDLIEDPRWRHGAPPNSNANSAWLQHSLASLAPGGRAAILMPDRATFARGREAKIRAAMIDSGAVEAVVALPTGLFHATGVRVSIWLLRETGETPREKVLFIDATGMGRMVERTRRALDDADIEWLGSVHREFRESDDVPESGSCRAVPLSEIREREYLLNPRSYLADPAASVDLTSALGTAREHHRGLAALAPRESEADTEVERQLERVGLWTPLNEDASAEWERVSLEEICDVLPGPGGILRDVEHDAEGVPILAPKNIHGNRIVDTDVDRIAPVKAEQKLSRYRLVAGDVLCVRTGDPGRTAYVGAKHAGALFGTSCFRLRPNETVLTGRYLTYWLGTPPARDWITRNTLGATVPSLNARMLRSMPVALPPLQVQVAIGEILRSLDDKIALHEKIGRATAELRDSLAALLGTGTFPLPEQYD